jgi:prepilin-type N-terminal cleavage/methylation domain-containing protein
MLRLRAGSPNKIQSQSQGLSLIEMLIALSILSVISLGVASLLTDTSQVIKNTEITDVRDQIARDIESAMQKFNLVKMSAGLTGQPTPDVVPTDPGNLALANCLSDHDKNRPNKCDASKRQLPFVMYSRTRGGKVPIAGGDNNSAVYYSLNGSPCSQVNCRYFRADAYFTPTCIASTAVGSARSTAQTCSQARSVTLQYQVVPLKPLPGAQRTLSKRPENLEESSIEHKVSGILSGQFCPSMAKMTGYTTDGKIVCECIAGAKKVANSPNNELIQCQAVAKCNAGEVWLGFGQDGMPVCASTESHCEDEKRTAASNGAFCGKGGWVDKISLGRCVSDGGEGGKKGEEMEVECPDARVSCCYENRLR